MIYLTAFLLGLPCKYQKSHNQITPQAKDIGNEHEENRKCCFAKWRNDFANSWLCKYFPTLFFSKANPREGFWIHGDNYAVTMMG